MGVVAFGGGPSSGSSLQYVWPSEGVGWRRPFLRRPGRPAIGAGIGENSLQSLQRDFFPRVKHKPRTASGIAGNSARSSPVDARGTITGAAIASVGETISGSDRRTAAARYPEYVAAFLAARLFPRGKRRPHILATARTIQDIIIVDSALQTRTPETGAPSTDCPNGDYLLAEMEDSFPGEELRSTPTEAPFHSPQPRRSYFRVE